MGTLSSVKPLLWAIALGNDNLCVCDCHCPGSSPAQENSSKVELLSQPEAEAKHKADKLFSKEQVLAHDTITCSPENESRSAPTHMSSWISGEN